MNLTEIQRLAGMGNALRPDWPVSSLATFIAKNLADRAFRDAALALTFIACDPDTKTPARVVEAGPWWHLTRPQTTTSVVATICPDHGGPAHKCLACRADVVPMPPEIRDLARNLRARAPDRRPWMPDLDESAR